MPQSWAELEVLNPAQRKLLLLAKMVSSEEDLKRFQEKIRTGAPNECWEWTASLNTDGYGQFAYYPIKRGKKVNFQAHQVAYFLEHGIIPEGLCVLHTCDNPKCNNPAHLFIGTSTDNNHDRDRKGRHKASRGEANGAVKLTSEQVQRVRVLRITYKRSAAEIAAMFGVSDSCIKGIIYGYNWKHLPQPTNV